MIFVDPRSNVITLEGAFKRPTDYELLKDQNISDAIFYANGLTVDADLSNIYLHRLLDGKIEDISISTIPQFKDILAKDKDRLFVRKHSFRNVKIHGAVLRPGSYKMIEGESIHDLIEKAGGYTQNAFPEGAIYLNEEAKTIDKNAADRLYNQFIDSMLSILQKSSAGSTDITSLVTFASELKNVEPNGRIVIDLKNDDETNFIKDKDSIFIPEKSNNVFIYGEILNEGSLIYKYGADLDFYLQEASGIKETADNTSIFILYPNGRTAQFARKRNLFASQQRSIEIPPGSVIYVPRKIDDSLSTRITAQAYATILGNIGVTLASISAIQNNN
jgi:protein involved in polysaccharide export with SLBB domain